MLYILLWCILGPSITSAVDNEIYKNQKTTKCGYASCNQHEPDVLNVHIVPHTHDDVGWRRTVDQYFFDVEHILNSVIKELTVDPERRFVYVESYFFFKWWDKQTKTVKDAVKQLVNEGRLQFAGGALSMNDEATTHYQSTIDHFTHGLRKLNETFGQCGVPRVAWQIDPFGHSREFASLLAAMGFDGLFLGRIDYQDRNNRLNLKNMEMIWRGDDELGNSSDIFTSVLYDGYSAPRGFCYDVQCSDGKIDDSEGSGNNVDEYVRKFLTYVRVQRSFYRTNNILIPMGGDFSFIDAKPWFDNLDKLIKYTNDWSEKNQLGIKLFYSTPQCYLKAVKNAEPFLPRKDEDFFPYASAPHQHWTGYYTSRPTLKYFERLGNSYLQMAKQLQVLANLNNFNIKALDELKNAMGIMQHHDAITGTEQQHVANDYEKILHNAIQSSLIIPREAFNKYTRGRRNIPTLAYKVCRLNESQCEVSESSDAFIVTLYNLLAWGYNESVRIPVRDGDYEVYSHKGQKIQTQLVRIPASITKIPTRNSTATHEIVFIAQLKPISYENYYFRVLKRHWNNKNILRKNKNDSLISKRKEERDKYKVYMQSVNAVKAMKSIEDAYLKEKGGKEVRRNENGSFYGYFKRKAKDKHVNAVRMGEMKGK